MSSVMSDAPASARPRVRVRRVSTAAIAALLVVFAATGAAAWGTHRVVRDQGQRLLKERSAELSLVFTQAVSTITTSMTSLLGVLRASGASSTAFSKAAAPEIAQSAATKLT